MKTNRVSEKGQALVFLVLGFVAFLGFVALAIDGGMAYSDHRNSQNASDAASLAGGGAAALVLDNNHVTWGNWSCTSNPDIPQAIAAAVAASIDRAGSNQFTIDQDRGDQNGATAECFEVPLGSFTDKYIDVTTEISMTTTTSFAQLLFPGGLNNRVIAVTRVRPRTPLAYGNAIVALNEAPCSGNSNGVVFGGSSDIDIIGGGVWSNGCLRGNGGQFTVDVEDGGVSYVGETSGEMDNINPAPHLEPEPLPPASYQVPAPNCSDPAAHQHADIVLNNGTLEMEPGLHCVSGRIRINGGTFTGTGVTFYVTGSGVTINGNAIVQLNAPAQDPDPSPAIPGVLFYVPNGDVSLEGTGQSWFLGLVYVPNGTIEVIGTGDVDQTFHTQLIGHDVYVSGNARIDIIFNESEEYQRPAYIELAR